MTKTQTRLDLYTAVHKGLRVLMGDTLATIGRIDPGDLQETADGLAKARGLLDICRDHLHHENQFIHPAMEARKPKSAWTTANQHVGHEEAFERLEGEITSVERSTGPQDRAEKLLSLYRSFSAFVAESLEHMLVEETENNAALWESYTDAELAGIHGKLVSSVPQERMITIVRWMLPAMSTPERLNMLAGVRATAPRETFEGLLAITESCLSPKDWNKIAAALFVTA